MFFTLFQIKISTVISHQSGDKFNLKINVFNNLPSQVVVVS